MAEPRTCLHCGEVIDNPYGQQAYHTMKNGGRDCGRERQVKMQSERRRLNRGSVFKQCTIDGVTFQTYDRREEQCSDACRAEAARRQKARKR